jgi:DNA-binding NtrC family response regulator
MHASLHRRTAPAYQVSSLRNAQGPEPEKLCQKARFIKNDASVVQLRAVKSGMLGTHGIGQPGFTNAKADLQLVKKMTQLAWEMWPKDPAGFTSLQPSPFRHCRLCPFPRSPGARMTQSILLFSKNPNLMLEIDRQLEGKHQLISCETLDGLPEKLSGREINAVLVHLDRTTLNGYSPGRFIAELDDAIENAPMYGLLDADCPPRLRKLANKAVDDCLDFPLDFTRLRRLLSDKQDLEGELAGFWSGMPHKELHGGSKSLVTFTPEMFETMDEIKVAARHNVTVLLIGETGSGKTFLARLIHELSDRREDRFCTVACGALPPDLIESELFGYVKGAFTGADKDREGKFAAAGSGTLLLDEIDVLPPDQQAKLLRVIETGEYEPVGSNTTQFSKARLIVASNYNLEELVRAGSFRTDLYYRLNILNFRLLPLRQRPCQPQERRARGIEDTVTAGPLGGSCQVE